ncbi:transcriptional regulator [Actinoalloteichus sp. AHMU CJ021]|uniref:helix-turn-helix transcriptional regulator n=1 Tax=Actinoalloteichus sp. AHMU CJ021 TaxID=2072503 RepID=UPI000CA00A34|nr:transcriptional regulator [Actinoalloteichus sp. AHMU CJ021]
MLVVLVERRFEFELLERLFAETAGGQGRIALVDGAAASGKTELLRTFADHRATHGAVVLSVTGSRGQGDRPFGGVRSLVASMRVPTARTAAFLRLTAGQRPALSDEPAEVTTFDVAQDLLELVLELSQKDTVLITVDDAQYVDAQSMECILHLANHTRSARIMLLVTEVVYDSATHPAYRIELIRQANFRRVRLAPLSSDGVAEILARHIASDLADRLAPACHLITGGNPLLVRALIEDQLDAPQSVPAAPDARPVIGDAFRQAVLTCLRRSGSDALGVARAVAVLGTDTTVGRVCALLRQPRVEVERAFQTLRLVGCLEDNDFKDALFRQAVLDCVAPAELSGLHRSAARVLHEDQAGVIVVARHLLATDHVPNRWAVQRLRQAAEDALRADQPAAAVDFLERALLGCGKGSTSAKLRFALLDAEWRGNPANAVRHLPRLLEHERAGELDVTHTARLLYYLLWNGRRQDAAGVLNRLGHEYRANDGDVSEPLKHLGLWLAHSHPEFAARWAKATGETQQDSSPASWPAMASVVLSTVLSGDSEAASVAPAERVLRATVLGDRTVEAAWYALQAMIYSDQLDVALRWCDTLLAESKVRGATWWEAMFSACRAEIALRYGELPRAASYANRAIRAVGIEGWGVGVGMPLGVLVSVGTVVGDHDAVQRHLRQPVPDEMFGTGFGVTYLRARGRYYLANGWSAAALKDFQRCGELMATWGFEAPGLAPWRTDAAETHLRLGHVAEARALAEEQLELGRRASARAHGAATRIVAATFDASSRLRLLKDAVELLQASGDRLELAHALLDLSKAHQALGQAAKARMVSHRAGRLLRACRLEMGPVTSERRDPPLSTTHGQSVPTVARPGAPGASEQAVIGALTTSEHRVAALAALGFTNREISGKLHITVSTVEQHLTKIFRKLKVTKRTDLPAYLRRDVNSVGKPGSEVGLARDRDTGRRAAARSAAYRVRGAVGASDQRTGSHDRSA